MRIGELASSSDVPVKTLRFYETEGLLPAPARLGNGYRDYSPDFVGRLRFIRQAQSAGLTLAQIREILDLHDQHLAPCDRVTDLLAQRLTTVQDQIAELLALQETLQGLLERARCGPSGASADVCWILESSTAIGIQHGT